MDLDNAPPTPDLHPEIHRPLYVAEILANALNQNPDRPLLRQLDGPTLSVSEVRDATSRYVQALQARGIGRGSKVGVLSSNRPEVLFVAQALQMLAAISVPLHPMGGLADMRHVLADSGMDMLVFEAARHGGRVAELAPDFPNLRLAGFGPGELAEDLCAAADSFAPAPLVPPVVSPTDVVRLGYSGGTTGEPKRLSSTQRVALENLRLMMSEWDWPHAPRVLSCAPLSHAGGSMFFPTVLKRGWMLILPGFDPLQVMEMIQAHRITCMMMVPTMIYALLDHPRFGEFDLSSLETVFYGASSIAPVRLKEAIERIGPVFFQFYGQAEAPMCLTVLRKDEHDVNDLRRLASCGRPVPWLRLTLLDSHGNPVADGEPGEICVRGPIVMDGYRDSPDLTRAAFAGGWLHTGDVAVRDPDGFLRIVDRTKDMIVTGGFNVYPRELEDVLGEHPGVAQVAVIGVPHPKWGEAVKALVVPRPGAKVEPDELVALVTARKGSYQAPKLVQFIEAIPQTAVGKPDKKALRALYGQPMQ